MFFTELMILIRSDKPEHSGGDGGLQGVIKKSLLWVYEKLFVKVSGKLQRRLEEKYVIKKLS